MATSHSSPVSARFDQFEVDLGSKVLRANHPARRLFNELAALVS
jgi:hypothetical protein